MCTLPHNCPLTTGNQQPCLEQQLGLMMRNILFYLGLVTVAVSCATATTTTAGPTTASSTPAGGTTAANTGPTSGDVTTGATVTPNPTMATTTASGATIMPFMLLVTAMAGVALLA
ncbi:uncharacterized protein LOC144922540 isoform X1 [Branchiostoma floridae x Branchiostoma belcheri]